MAEALQVNRNTVRPAQSRLGGLIHWTVSHVFRRRAAQLALFLFLLIGSSVVVAALGPWPFELRIVYATAAGFVLFGALLFYLAYRSWDFARRLSHEAVKTRQLLLSTQGALAIQQNRATVNLLTSEKLDRELGQLRREQSGTGAGLAAVNARLLAMASRFEGSLSVMEDVRAQTDRVAASHAGLAIALKDLREDAAAGSRRNEERDAVMEAWNARLAGITRERDALIASLAALQGQVARLTGAQSQMATQEDLARQVSAASAASLGELERQAAALEALADASQSRLRAEMERAAAIADLAAGLDQRIMSLESRVSTIAEQGSIPLSRVDELEDRISEALLSSSTAIDQLSAQIEPLKELARTEAGRVSELSVTVQALDGAVAEVSRTLAASAIDEISEKLATLEQDLEASVWKAESSNATSFASVSAMSGRIEALELALGQESARLRDFVQDLSSLREDGVTAAADINKTVFELSQSVYGAREGGDDEMRAAIEKLRQEIAAAASKSGLSTESYAASLADGLADGRALVGKDVEALASRIDDLARQITELSSASGREQGVLSGRVADLNAGMDAHTLPLADLKAELASLASRFTEVSAEMNALATGSQAALQDSIRASGTEIDAVKKGLADLSRTFGATTTSSRQIFEQLSDQFTSLREAMTGEFGRVGALTARLATLESAFEGANLSGQQDVLQAKIMLEDMAIRLTEALSSIEEQLTSLSTQVLSTTVLAEETDRRQVLDGASWFEPNNRKLRLDHVERLETEWARKLSLDLSRPAIGYMTTRIAVLEREMDGRLRSSIEDTLLRTLVAKSVKGASVRVLELGASFGVETAVMHDQLKDHFAEVGFTLLDPLDAGAHAPRVDRQTGLQVSERIVRRNLARVGLPDSQATLIKAQATDPDAIKQASVGTYDVLVIDADHSYAGVKACFETYARMVKLGGYIIFAEYGSPEWPDVQAFVDGEIAVSSHVAPVGTSWRTAVYRVVKLEQVSAPLKVPRATAKAVASRRKK